MRETAKITADTEAAERIREAAAGLARHRGGPCLVFVSRSLVHADVLTVRTALGSAHGNHLDVIVAGPGGVSEAAYLLARELRRRFTHLTAYVPFEAKSAATLLCLAADALVPGRPRRTGSPGPAGRGEAEGGLPSEHLPAPPGAWPWDKSSRGRWKCTIPW